MLGEGDQGGGRAWVYLVDGLEVKARDGDAEEGGGEEGEDEEQEDREKEEQEGRSRRTRTNRPATPCPLKYIIFLSLVPQKSTPEIMVK